MIKFSTCCYSILVFLLKYFGISVEIFLYFHLKDMFVWGAPVCVGKASMELLVCDKRRGKL